MPHPQRERAHARPAILAAARKLFKQKPYATISVEQIAACALVSRYTLSNHFSSKEEIFRLSREALIAEVADLVADAIPPKMKTQQGIILYLENCFSVFTSEANLELMKSIINDGSHHPWLEDAHQRQIRLRLIQSCETFLLYHVDHTDEIFEDIRIIAEQLTALVEGIAYGPYRSIKDGEARSQSARQRQFAAAARAIGAMLDNGRLAATLSPLL